MSRINQNQKDILLEFMAKNYLSLYGKFSKDCGKDFKEKLWNNLLERVNNVGPHKTLDQWKRVSFFFITLNINCVLIKHLCFHTDMVRLEDESKR